MLTLKNTSAVVAWDVHRGDDWVFPIVKTNSPVSMSGWTWVAQVRASRDRTSTLIANFSADTSAADDGTVIFSHPASETTSIEAGEYYFEIQKTVDGVVTTLVGGPLRVVADTADD